MRPAVAALCAAACLAQAAGAAPAGAADPVRRMADASDYVALRATPASAVTGAVTIAALVRPDAAESRPLVSLNTSAGSPAGYALEQTSGGALTLTDGRVTAAAPAGTLAFGRWQLVVATKAAGSATPRFHVLDLDAPAPAWRHVSAGGAIGDGGAVPGGAIGLGARYGAADMWDGDYAAAAIFPAALSDGAVEALDDGYPAWLAARPGGMWILNQPDGSYSVLDETGGGADEHLAISGSAPAAAGLSPFAGDPDTTIFRGDFSTGSTNQWTWEQRMPDPGPSIAVASANPAPPAGESRYGRFELDGNETRAEVTHLMRMGEGEDAYVRFLARVDPGFPLGGGWGQIFFQLHNEGIAGSPPIALVIKPGSGLIVLEDHLGLPYWHVPTLLPGTWHEFVIRVLHRSDPDDGRVQAWLDGVPQTLADGRPQMAGQTLLDAYNYPKTGYYRSSGTTGYGVVQIAGFRIARTYADAQP